jgi:CheY-like chemotaxis protein
MIVDDEPDILLVTKMAIEMCGFSAETFRDPFAALQKFKEGPGAYALVLTDIRMPKMDGIELARELMQVRPDIPIVLMTAFNVDGNILTSLPMMKKEDIVKKPFNPSDLCSTVRVRLQKK